KFLALLASATAAAAAAVAPRQTNLLYPHRTYRRWVHQGDMIEDPQDQLLVVKNGNLEDETSTIVSFVFDKDTAGKQCQLRFELWEDRDISTGSQQLDVFTYKNLPEDVRVLAEVLERDVHVGRIEALTDRQEAEWKLS